MLNFVKRPLASTLCYLIALSISSPALAWHQDGHMLVARVAWRELSDQERAQVTKRLKAHPHYDVYLAAERPEGVPEAEWASVRAATWSDWVRDPKGAGLTKEDARAIKDKFNKPVWHYVNLPYLHPSDVGKFDAAAIRKKNLEPELDAKGEPRHVLAALKQCMSRLQEADRPETEKAVCLTWLFHLVGDIHQPLHATALIASKDTFDPSFDPPHGDQGGNLLAIKVKANDLGALKLHFYWDALLFSDEPPFAKVDEVATGLLGKFKRGDLPELSATDYLAWAEESLNLAKTVVYKGDGGFLHATPLPSRMKVDLATVNAPVLSDGYQKEAEAVAARRMVLAGYRLADQVRLALKPGK